MSKLRLPRLALASLFALPFVAQAKFEPPVPVRTVAPQYPDDLRRQGVMGVVYIKFTVDARGNVVDPQVQKSSNSEFNQPAIDAVRKWKFKPAQMDGKPVAKKVAIPIRFVES